ncbi:hypothetical protein [Hymenobacter cellulosivorans]|uniref:Lipoprotein n=1 Tax=Hymenobacter cellulosivorans TaxID=2932249 RepID=A0ABY4F4J3_9BACT|nr:hypothetical protein [Hymenobacter cellulosivorans]UOQ51379.1 hypothetical protein MUN80_16615 [Hymenobacter cellulosivorans]
MIKIFANGHRSASFGLVLALLAGSGCKKVEDIVKPKLPEATQEGKGTFGCMVDGTLWLPFVQHTLDSKLEADYAFTGGGIFHLRAEQEPEGKPYQYIHLSVLNQPGIPLKLGTYTAATGFEARLEAGNEFVTTPAGPATLTITKVEPHTEKMPTGGEVRYTIVAGTFEFEATHAASGQKAKLTEGRFDVKAY